MLSLTDIKKALYKGKQLAHFNDCRTDNRGMRLLYSCELTEKDEKPLYFRVPVEDIGDGVFPAVIYAHMLIRYIVLPENTEA